VQRLFGLTQVASSNDDCIAVSQLRSCGEPPEAGLAQRHTPSSSFFFARRLQRLDGVEVCVLPKALENDGGTRRGREQKNETNGGEGGGGLVIWWCAAPEEGKKMVARHD
jgi:hypothetical protein